VLAVDPMAGGRELGERPENVRAPGRGVHGAVAVTIEIDGDPTPTWRRSGAQTDDGVVGRSPGAPDERGLAPPGAAVQSSDDTTARPGHAVLDERLGVDARR